MEDNKRPWGLYLKTPEEPLLIDTYPNKLEALEIRQLCTDLKGSRYIVKEIKEE